MSYQAKPNSGSNHQCRSLCQIKFERLGLVQHCSDCSPCVAVRQTVVSKRNRKFPRDTCHQIVLPCWRHLHVRAKHATSAQTNASQKSSHLSNPPISCLLQLQSGPGLVCGCCSIHDAHWLSHSAPSKRTKPKFWFPRHGWPDAPLCSPVLCSFSNAASDTPTPSLTSTVECLWAVAHTSQLTSAEIGTHVLISRSDALSLGCPPFVRQNSICLQPSRKHELQRRALPPSILHVLVYLAKCDNKQRLSQQTTTCNG